RCEALSLFEQEIDADAALERLKALENSGKASLSFFGLVLCALARAFHEQPALNRYVMGRRIYQRRHVAITFSGQVSPGASAPVYLRKKRFPAGESTLDAGNGIFREVHRGRAGATSGGDRFLRAFLRLPWPVGSLLMRFARALDHCNLIPARWVLAHPLHASAFVANLGSVGIPSAYHPLYEHGAIPLALVVGELRESISVCAEGHAGARHRCTLKYSYDGRIAEAAECARFAARVKVLLEDPELLAPDDTRIAGEAGSPLPCSKPEVPCHTTDDASL
ncbi:MAG: 2-oxo acid dehydrogenase subunit E2, partial [Myxococcales bacterium]|nr:2-oxo acid dehydrogenase subunit E2 [Myxococcales bacterium]